MRVVVYVAVPAVLIAAALFLVWRRDRGRGIGGALSDQSIENARRQAAGGHAAADQARLRRGGIGGQP